MLNWVDPDRKEGKAGVQGRWSRKMSTAGARQAVQALGIPDSGCSSFSVGITRPSPAAQETGFVLGPKG